MTQRHLENTKMDGKPVVIVVPTNAQSLDVSGPLDALLEANPRQMHGIGKCADANCGINAFFKQVD
jgi:hypothetical protein